MSKYVKKKGLVVGTVHGLCSSRRIYSFVQFSVFLLVHLFYPSGYTEKWKSYSMEGQLKIFLYEESLIFVRTIIISNIPIFCLSLGLLSSVQAWFLCCQRATIPMCVMELQWLWVSAVRALETR